MTVAALTFGSPWLLACLVVPALALAAYVWLERRPAKAAVAYPNLAVLATVVGRSSWRRHVLAGLLLAAIALLCVGLARPRIPLTTTSDHATVVLVVDVSVSMNAKDVAPSRLEAARTAIRTFVQKVPGRVKVGLIAFADDPVVVTAPTTDRKLIQNGINSLSPGFGTAIGDAVARAVDVVRATAGDAGRSDAGARKEPLGAVVLLSDGAQTRGVLAPEDGARLAKNAHIPVYTIALGTLTGTVTIDRGDGVVTVPVPPDRATLASIAETTGGSTFAATDAGKLGSVYRRLGGVVAKTSKPREVTAAFVGVAAALLAASIGLASLWAPKLP
jgi:Ca-activated chloride channel family protein